MKQYRKLTIVTSVALAGLISACGTEQVTLPGGSNEPVDVTEQIARIDAKITALSVVAGTIEAVINSPYSDCSLADDLLETICNLAQAAAVEGDVEVLNALGNMVAQLQSQIDADRVDLVAHQASIDAANAAITAQNGSIAANAAAIASAQLQLDNLESDVDDLTDRVDDLETRMDTAEAAIDALEALTAAIGGTLNGVMLALSIGEELVSAGPVYEQVLRRNDKKRINGYVLAYNAYQSFGNNPVTAVNGSSTVTIALTAHGYSNGNIVELDGLAAGRGFLTGHLKGKFTVSGVAANTFQVTLAGTATSGGTLGGTLGVVRKFNGQGMGTLWKSDDASDVAVRQTTAGSFVYNFIIRRIASDLTNDTAELCYDKTNRSATFATINAAPEGGNVNIACK